MCKAGAVVMHRYQKNIDFFLFSQVVMSPYGYTKVKPESFDEQAAAMMAFVDGLKTQFNATFRYGTAANTMCKCVHWWSTYVIPLGLTETRLSAKRLERLKFISIL